MVDERKGHGLGSFDDEGSVVFVGYRVAQRTAQMTEPALRDSPGDGQILVLTIQRAPGRFAVARWSPEPLGEEQSLPLTSGREIPAEERPEHTVNLETVIKGVD